MKVLVTCPPMLGRMEMFRHLFDEKGIEVYCPKVVQTLSEEDLKELVPHYDGWIIGDDPATSEVFDAGRKGKLKAAVKWGVGVDNVDFVAAKKYGIRIANTPNMFGREVADVAMSYVAALARDTFFIDREVRAGNWPKPCGISLAGKTVALVGFGDIGRNTAKRMIAAEMKVVAYDPFVDPGKEYEPVEFAQWPDRLEDADFIVFTCSLTPGNRQMLNAETLSMTKKGVRVVNVSRGGLIDQSALIAALESGQVHSAALDVMETEPLPSDSQLRKYDRCILGSHNASNTLEAVYRTSERAIQLLFEYLGIEENITKR